MPHPPRRDKRRFAEQRQRSSWLYHRSDSENVKFFSFAPNASIAGEIPRLTPVKRKTKRESSRTVLCVLTTENFQSTVSVMDRKKE